MVKVFFFSNSQQTGVGMFDWRAYPSSLMSVYRARSRGGDQCWWTLLIPRRKHHIIRTPFLKLIIGLMSCIFYCSLLFWRLMIEFSKCLKMMRARLMRYACLLALWDVLTPIRFISHIFYCNKVYNVHIIIMLILTGEWR